jgi:hypothetical protein
MRFVDRQRENEINVETYFRIKNTIFSGGNNDNNEKKRQRIDAFINNIKEITLCNQYTSDPQKKLDKCSSYLFTNESNPEVVIHFKQNLNENIQFNMTWFMPNGKKRRK